MIFFSGHLRELLPQNLAAPKATLWISSSEIPMFEAKRCGFGGFMWCRSVSGTLSSSGHSGIAMLKEKRPSAVDNHGDCSKWIGELETFLEEI